MKCKVKGLLSLFIILSIVFQSIGLGGGRAKGETIATDTYYVGGFGASDGNSGISSEEAFATISHASSMINSKGLGSYKIIVQGEIVESKPIKIGDGVNPIQVAITNTVTGSAIVVRGTELQDDYIVVENSATLTLGDETGVTSEQFVLDGGNNRPDSAAINVKEGANLKICSNVTIQNHRNWVAAGCGGAIYNLGTVTLDGGRLISNHSYYGGAIYNKGTLFLKDGTLSSNMAYLGGAIYNSGTVYMTGGLVDENEMNIISDNAGAIYNSGNLVIEGGTISANEGAIYSIGDLSLCKDARIPWDGAYNYLNINHYINIPSKLNGTDKVILNSIMLSPGQSVLKGDSKIIASSYSQFEFVDQLYGIDNTGKIIDGEAVVHFYIGGENASDFNPGTDPSLPLASLEEAIARAKSGISYIVTLQSNIEVANTLYIDNSIDITIQSDDGNRKIIPTDSALGWELFSIYTGTLSLGGGGSGGNLSIQGVETHGYLFGNQDTLIFKDGFEVFETKLYRLVNNSGHLIIEGGSYHDNELTSSFIINSEDATMNMTGGTIKDNYVIYDSDYAIIVNDVGASIHINGGSIINNKLLAVENGGSVNFSTGSITDNMQDFKMEYSGKLTISGDAMVDTINMENCNNAIQIANDLISDNIVVKLKGYPVGKEILGGSPLLLQANYEKFILENTNYRINEAGKLEYIGTSFPIYYVGGIGADDENDGTGADTPFATLNKGIMEAGSSTATIIIQADQIINELIEITGNITIISDGTSHTISRDSYYYGRMFYVSGKLILGNSDFSGSDSSTDIIIDGGSKDNIQAQGSIIHSIGGVYIYPGVVLQNNYIDEYSNDDISGIHNFGGTLYMYGGIIRNNTSPDFTIYNENSASFIMTDGSIYDNIGDYCSGVSVIDDSSFLMEGGSIKNNIASGYSGVHVGYGSTFNMKGGTISGNNDGKAIIGMRGMFSSDCAGVSLMGGSTFIMDGGNISNNSNKNPNRSAGVVIFDSIFIMNEGNITDNTGMNCAGVYINNTNDRHETALIMNKGNISDNKSDAIAGLLSINTDITINAGLISNNIGRMSGIYLAHSGLILNGGTISENKAEMFAGIASIVMESPTYINRLFRLNGGLIQNNKSKYSGILAMDTIQMSGDTIIRGGDKINILHLPPEYAGLLKHGIELIGAIPDSTPEINVATYRYNVIDDSISTLIEIPVGSQIIYSRNGYEFTKEDLSKLKLESEEYTINIEGRVGINLKNDWVTLSESSELFYDNDEKTIIITINDGIKTLSADEDFVVLYENNINAGSAQITISGKGGYAGTLYQSFTINPRKLSEEWVIMSDTSSVYYDGNEKKVSIIISDGNKELTKDVDYTLSYSNNTEIGDAEVRIEGIGNYSGIIIEGFRISEKPTLPTWPIYYSPGPVIPDKPKEIEEITVSVKEGSLTVDINKMPEESIDENKDEIVLTIPTKDILGQMANEEVKDVEIRIKEDEKLSGDSKKKKTLLLKAEVLEAAKDTKKGLSVSVEDEKGREKYTWSFSSDEMNSSQKDLEDVNLYLEVHETEITEINSDIDTEDTKGLLIDFAHEGELPSQANVRIYVGDIKDIKPGSSIYLYHINKETGLMETLPFSAGYEVDEDGYISVNILHCSDYAVFPKELSGDLISSLRNQISISIDKKTIYAGGNIDASARVSVKLPPTLERVDSLKSETSQTAIAGVTVSYRSSNKKVASVDGEGKVIAKSKGKASIYATVTLYSGKTKVVIFKINVKEPYIQLTKSRDIMELGSIYKYRAEAYGLDIKDLIWTTKRKSVVEINKNNGLATAKSRGIDYVVATINGVAKKIKVVVE